MFYDLPEDKTVARYARAADMRKAYARIRAAFFSVIEGKSVNEPVPLPPTSAEPQANVRPRALNFARVSAIQKIVARNHQITVADLVGPSRTWRCVKPRQVAIYVARDVTQLSCPDIGRRFGGRDHATVLSSIKRVESDADLLADAKAVIRELGGDPDDRRPAQDDAPQAQARGGRVRGGPGLQGVAPQRVPAGAPAGGVRAKPVAGSGPSSRARPAREGVSKMEQEPNVKPVEDHVLADKIMFVIEQMRQCRNCCFMRTNGRQRPNFAERFTCSRKMGPTGPDDDCELWAPKRG